MWTYITDTFYGLKVVRTFHERELQKANQTEYRIGNS